MSSTAPYPIRPRHASTIAGLPLGTARLDERGEDRLLVDPEIGLFGVFDGVGGHVDGAATAELAAVTVAAQVRENLPHCPPRPWGLGSASTSPTAAPSGRRTAYFTPRCTPRTPLSSATTRHVPT